MKEVSMPQTFLLCDPVQALTAKFQVVYRFGYDFIEIAPPNNICSIN